MSDDLEREVSTWIDTLVQIVAGSPVAGVALARLVAGDPSMQRVRDILPPLSESERVADDLRGP